MSVRRALGVPEVPTARAALAGCVLVSVMSGCAGNAPDRPSTPTSRPPATSSPTPATSAPPTTQASAPGSPSTGELPELDELPGKRDLLVAHGTGASPTSWQIAGTPGTVWVAVNCRGDGKLVVGVSPTASFGIVCTAGVVTPSLNQIDLATPKQWTVTVSGPSSVTWGLRVRQ